MKNNKLPKRPKRKKNKYSSPESMITNGAVSTVPFVVDSFLIDQASSGNGGFTSQASAASLTAANGFNIDPYNLGGMPYRLGTIFEQYRILWLRVDYHPYSTSSGVMSTISGLTASPNYGSRNFAWGISGDPFTVLASYGSIVIAGGKESNTAQKSSISMVGGTLLEWRYTSTTTASPSNIDLRMVAPARVNFAYQQNSTTATATYGNITVSGLMQVRYQLDNAAPVGVSSQNIKASSKDEAKKPENSSSSSWFGSG